MPPLKFSRIVSFSTEDPLHPAISLLSKGKWTCKDEGEAEAWVILQLEEMSIISDLDLGNNGAAFIEVQVGRLGMEVKDYQTLLVASSFMSPGEARLGDMATRVRMFGHEKLSAAVAKEKWDMVKVVATQPFTKHTRYGIAFVTVSGKTASGAAPSAASTLTAPSLKLGAFRLKEGKTEEIAVGSLFRRQKEQEVVGGGTSVAASLRADKTLADMALAKAEKEESKRKRSDEGGDEAKMKKIRPEGGDLPRRDGVPGESRADMFRTFEPKKEEVKKKEKVSNVKHSDLRKERKAIEEDLKERVKKYKNQDNIDGKDTAVAKQSGSHGKAEWEGSTKNDQGLTGKPKFEEGNWKGQNGIKVAESKKPTRTAPFRDLLRGVVFAISGFQNPLRGEIRGKALEMGAKYEPDWSNKCTHLICAFTNTPKFQQVKTSGGKIVKKEWVEECHFRRKRLPWRRFCLDRADQGDESEDEVWEQGAITSNGVEAKREAADAYDQDTDEEVEQLKQRDAKEAEEEKKRLDAEEKKAQELKNKEMEVVKEKEKLRKENEKKIQQLTEKKEKEAEQNLARQRESKIKENTSKDVNSYDAETDEEVEEVEVRLEDDHDSAYDADTDVDEDVAEKLRPETKHLEFPNLPSFFSSMQFYMHGDYDKGEDDLVKRYIVAFGGKVVPNMKRTVARVITASNWWSEDFEELQRWNPDVVFLRPSWVFACSDQGRQVEEGTHRVRKS